MSDLTPKSTPISELSCPAKARFVLLDEPHTVTNTGDNEYTCSCGEVFLWDDQFHWDAAPIGEGL